MGELRCDGLFKFNHLTDITPTQYHNLARSLHNDCYVTTKTSSTFSIYSRSICIQGKPKNRKLPFFRLSICKIVHAVRVGQFPIFGYSLYSLYY